MQFEEYDYTFKVVLVGNVSVGKSGIFLRYTRGEFKQKYQSTVGVEFGSKSIELSSREGPKQVKLQIWDTAGSERYKSMAKGYYKGAVGILLVYDVTQEQSFLALNQWITLISNNLDPKELTVILLGNKIDKDLDRQVSTERGRKFAEQNKFLFKEVSAKTGEGISATFFQLAKQIHKQVVCYNFDSVKQTVIEPSVARKSVVKQDKDKPKPTKLQKNVTERKEKSGPCC